MSGDAGKALHFRLLSVELAASRKLGRKLQRLLWHDMTSVAPPGIEFAISYVLFLRAERTFSSIRTLARMQLVDDAFALVRVLVERVINGEFLILAGTEPALDFMQYHAFREWRDFEDLRQVSAELIPKHTAEFLAELQKAHDKAKTRSLPDGSKKNRYGRGSDWIEMGLSKRAEFVDDSLKQRFSMTKQTSTRVLYHIAYKKGAVYLHGMWASLARSLEIGNGSDHVDAEGYCEMSVGIRVKDRNPHVAASALNAANLAAFSLILFLDRVFMNKVNQSWVTDFKDRYVLDLKKARTPS